MVVKKLNNGKWQAKISYRDKDDMNKVMSKKRQFDTKREAQEFEYKFKQQLKTDIDDSMTYESLFDAYMEHSKQNANERTQATKQLLANKFWSNLFKKKVTKITKKDYLDVWLKISQSDYSAGRKNKAIHLLKGVSKFGYLYYDFNDNAKTLNSIKEPPREHRDMNVWTYDDLIEFLPHLDNSLIQVLIWFLFFTGLRIGEARALKIEDFNGIDVTINKSVRSYKEGLKPLKTHASKRTIQIDDTTKALIEPLLQQEGEFVFGGIEPIGMSTVQRAWEKAQAKSKSKKIKIHDLRHSHASYLINNDVNIVAVSRRLGHSDVETTLRTYTHLLEETNKKMMNILNSSRPTKDLQFVKALNNDTSKKA